jgi:hypothetical protein
LLDQIIFHDSEEFGLQILALQVTWSFGVYDKKTLQIVVKKLDGTTNCGNNDFLAQLERVLRTVD